MMAGRRAPFPFIIALATVAGACQSQPAAAPVPPPVSQDVWAVVDGRDIRSEEIDKAYRRTVRPDQAMSADEITSTKLSLLDQLIAQEIMLARANELKIVLPESELDAAFNEGKKNLSDDAFARNSRRAI